MKDRKPSNAHIRHVLNGLHDDTRWRFDKDDDRFMTMKKVVNPKAFAQTIKFGFRDIDDDEIRVPPDGAGFMQFTGDFCRQHFAEIKWLPERFPQSLNSLAPDRVDLRRA